MNKVEALRKTIYNLENNVYNYDWGNFDSCNCGILSRTLLNGKAASECGFNKSFALFSPVNSLGHNPFSSQTHCLNTGIELTEVFQLLKDAGFTHDEMCNLEYLKDKEIVSKAGLEYCVDYYRIKDNLIKYLKAWVEILEEKEVTEIKSETTKPEPIHEKVKTVYVSVSETLKPKAKELITNQN